MDSIIHIPSSFTSKDAGENEPRKCIPSVVQTFEGDHLRTTERRVGSQMKDMITSYPIERGTIKDWEAMDQVLDNALVDSLCIDKDIAAESTILLTEPALNTHKSREKLIEYMFETMNFGAVNVSNQAVLALYGQGLLTGIVVECGEGVTQVVPIYEGIVQYYLIKRHGVNGNTITKYLLKLLQLHGCYSRTATDLEIVRDMKEKLCYAACDLKVERKLARETTVQVEKYILPDGTSVKIGQERFEATEVYFDPSIIDVECKGLSDLVFDTIQECEIDCRKQFYEHILLS